LDETEEIVISIKTRLQESKEIEEDLKIQLIKKQETCHILELEVINLKNKIDKTKAIVKFQNILAMLDKIWNNKKPIDDKNGLG
jgi:hypothetical protein